MPREPGISCRLELYRHHSSVRGRRRRCRVSHMPCRDGGQG
jgi:hypothetical protein